MTDEVEVEAQQDPLADALAEYLGVPPENIKGFVIAVENEIWKLNRKLQNSVDLFVARAQGAEAENDRLRAALEQIAASSRPDGTYNLSREACEQIAREALNRG